MANTNPQPTGQTERVDPETAYIRVDGTRVAETATMSFETEDNSENEDLLSGNTSEYDGRVKPSGSFSLSPHDPALPAIEELHLNRGIFDIVAVYPENDTRSTRKAIDCRIDSKSDDDIESGSTYLINFEFSGNYVE